MDSNTNENNILIYENSIKELEKLENEKMNLYKDLGELNLSEENKTNLHNKIDIQNKKISEETQKGIEAITKIDKAKDLTSEQKARVEQIAKKHKPENDVLEFMFSYPQISREFEEFNIDDVKELAKIIQSSDNPKMDWNEARKIMKEIVEKRELNEKEEASLDEELDIPKAELDIPKAELDIPKAVTKNLDPEIKEVEPEIKEVEPEIKEVEPETKEVETEIKKSISNISDINSFAKTIKPNVLNNIINLNTNTCSEILTASIIINSKYPFPSQFPNLTKIKIMDLEPKKVEDIKEIKKEEDIKKGGKKLKSRSKTKRLKTKKNKKNKTCKYLNNLKT